MEKITDDTLNLWREEGRHLIPQHFAEFQGLLEQAKGLAQRGKYDEAASLVGIAAQYAQFNHGGFFTSPELEQILIEIGLKTVPSHLYPWQKTGTPDNPQKVLHVSTNISTFSGIPRLIRRWIQQDSGRSHSLALTTQAPDEVPQILQDTVRQSHGQIHILNNTPGNFVARAKRLRQFIAQADIVVTHAWEYDVIPLIALADKTDVPPSIYTNHGDHWFWLGAGVSDIVANLRESGMRLSQARRGISPERNMVLPTVLEPLQRVLTRPEAKQKLGIDPSCVMLLSIARAPKYKTMSGMNFAEIHVPLLTQHKNAILVIVGAGDIDEDWSEAIAQTEGRIRVLGQTEETAVFYQAADIYVDAFPFVSNTSLLEAGSYGTPLVSRNPYALESCEIFGADMPGLTGNMIQAKDLEDYIAKLSKLIQEKGYRLDLGTATQKKIVETHWGDHWLSNLETVYRRAATLPRVSLSPHSTTKMFLGEPDVFCRSTSSLGKADLQRIMHWQMPLMPFAQRLGLWIKLVKKYGFSSNPLNTLMTPRLRSQYYLLRSRISKLYKS